MLGEFKSELLQLESESATLDEYALELLARHHGLPSPHLDWTESPFIASYFAFAKGAKNQARNVAIWMLDRAKIPPDLEEVDIIDDEYLLQFNKRALRQRGVFVRLNSRQPLEKIVADALTKFELPANEYKLALIELDEMTVNSTYLFSDLDGAAKTASLRVSTWEI